MPIADYHEQFASIYDTMYSARDVEGEVRFACEMLELDGRFGSRPHVLDFGCGTGSHVLAFGRRGVRATGLDISPAMIARANDKRLGPDSAEVAFHAGRLDDPDGPLNGSTFDGAVSFFNVLNCMESADVMLTHLREIRDRLAAGGRLLVEVWNGAAVFVDEPHPDVRHFPTGVDGESETVRITLPDVDRVNQRCTLRYRVLTLDRPAGRYREFESLHQLHFLTPVQYRHLFALAGLSILDEFAKGRPGVPITEHDWYICYLVRRDQS